MIMNGAGDYDDDRDDEDDDAVLMMTWIASTSARHRHTQHVYLMGILFAEESSQILTFQTSPYLPIYKSIYLSIYLSICLSIYLSI